MAFVLRCPASQDVFQPPSTYLRKSRPPGVDDQAAVALQAGVDAVGVEIDRGAEAAGVDGRGRRRGRRGRRGVAATATAPSIAPGGCLGAAPQPAIRNASADVRRGERRERSGGGGTVRSTSRVEWSKRRKYRGDSLAVKSRVATAARARPPARSSSTSMLAEAPGATLQAQPPGSTASLWAATA